MRYKAYTYDAGRQLNPLEDYPFFLENGVFVSHYKGARTFRLTKMLNRADGIYKTTHFGIFFIPESHPFFNIDVITNPVEGYGQIPIITRKHPSWKKFMELTYKYIKKISKAK